MFGKGSKSSYKLPNGDVVETEFLTSKLSDGYRASVGFVDHYRKEVSPCHGYYYPNRRAKSLMKYALRIGYTYVDCNMPSRVNETLLKKIYKTAKKQNIFIGRIMEISPSMGVLDYYEIVDIISQTEVREADSYFFLSKVAMRKIGKSRFSKK